MYAFSMNIVPVFVNNHVLWADLFWGTHFTTDIDEEPQRTIFNPTWDTIVKVMNRELCERFSEMATMAVPVSYGSAPTVLFLFFLQ